MTSFIKKEETSELDNLIREISKEYNEIKGFYDFPMVLKGLVRIHMKIWLHLLSFSDFEWKNKLRYVRIYFDTPIFDKIKKDTAVKFVDILSAIGGTMGLLTGFSIISVIEIIYFSLKILRSCINKRN